MVSCDSCGSELDASWKFCLYCGRPLVAAPSPSLTEAVSPSLAKHGKKSSVKHKRIDASTWIGVGMALLGVVLIVYAAIQIYGANG